MNKKTHKLKKAIAMVLSLALIVAGVNYGQKKNVYAEETKAFLIDFESYNGTEENPNVHIVGETKPGDKYTFSFSYRVEGESTGTRVISALNEWGAGSVVKFENNVLQGSGTYSTTFEADYTSVVPVFQTTVSEGKPKLYVWNIKLVKEGTEDNLFGSLSTSNFEGETSLVSETTIDPTKIGGGDEKVILFDFENYNGTEENPNAFIVGKTNPGDKYSFSFSYYVEGESTGTRVVSALNEWGAGSIVKFENNVLQGSGVYSTTFEADHTEVIPAFQTCVSEGKPKLYVWNIKLVKEGTTENILKGYSKDSFTDNFGIVSEYESGEKETTEAPTPTITPTTPATTEKAPTVTTKAAEEKTTATVTKLGSTKITKATKKKAAAKVSVTFKKVSGATKYQVQISTSKKFNKVLVKKTVKKVTVTISSKKLKNKKKLYIRVKAVGADKWSNAKKIKIKK